ncbi:MAG: DNA polymerase IV [bacterium]|nr:DNA polymerase IV [bacterium]
MHLDMDAFFAAIEERDKPRLRGRPIVIGADPMGGRGRGVVSTANYLAREYGIKSALPISRAWKYSQQAKAEGKPEAVFLEPNIKKAEEEGDRIFSYLITKVDTLQVASIDEAYADISSVKTYKNAEELAKEIKNHIKSKFGLTASIGIGPNKLIAKIASDEEKPDGLTIIPPQKVQVFLDPKSVRIIPGIGPKAEEELAKINIKTIKGLRSLNKETLVKKFGKRGSDWYEKSRGQDDNPITVDREIKSIGKEHTFQKDTLDSGEIIDSFKKLIRSVTRSIAKKQIKFKTVAIKVRFSDFQTLTRSKTLKEYTSSAKVLETESLQLLLPFLDSRSNPKRKKIRLIGIRAENLTAPLK